MEQIVDGYTIDNNKYKSIGFQYAQDSQVNPEVISNGLAKVLATFREDSRSMTTMWIEKLKNDIEILKGNKTDCINVLENEKLKVQEKEDIIKNLEKQKDDVKDRKRDTAENITIALQTFGIIVLFLFLYVFYASVGFSVLLDNAATNISTAILNTNVFELAARQGGAAIAIAYLIPAVILAFGLLIHWFLGQMIQEKDKTKKTKWIFSLVIFVCVAFIFDAIAGYKISENVYNAKVAQGLTEQLWKFSLIFKDVNFYLVLILGFVTYLAWGILLHALISNPVFNLNDQIEKLKEKIESAKSELFNIKKEVNNKESELSKLNDTITKEIQNLNYYEKGGGVHFDEKMLRGVIGEFMSGYASYVTPYCNNKEKAKEIMDTAKEKQIEWENSIIPNLNVVS